MITHQATQGRAYEAKIPTIPTIPTIDTHNWGFDDGGDSHHNSRRRAGHRSRLNAAVVLVFSAGALVCVYHSPSAANIQVGHALRTQHLQGKHAGAAADGDGRGQAQRT
jgi:hypothetical protein